MRPWWIVAIALVAPARADDAGEPAYAPHPARVHARLDGAGAMLVARFELAIEGRGHSSFALAIPPSSLVTGATAIEDGVTHRLALQPVAAAKRAFADAASGDGPGQRGWAIVVTAEPGLPAIGVRVIAPRATTLAVELEVVAPTCLVDDTRVVAIPQAWRRAVDATAKVRERDDVLDDSCGGEPHDAWIEFPVRVAGADRVATTGGRVAASAREHARVEVALPAQLGDVPDDLYTALVVDASRSLDVDAVEAQRAIIADYLRRAPASRVQVIAYARHATALLPAWTTAAAAAPRVDRELRALALHNGSNLDVGLAAARTWLDRVRGTRRVIVFTDELLPQRLHDAAALRGALSSDTLVHVVALGFGPLVRDDAGELAPLALATRGISVRGGDDRDDGDATTVDATVLARPISFDRLAIAGTGWTAPTDTPDRLREGRALVWQADGAATSSSSIAVTGWIWGREIKRDVPLDPSHPVTVARQLVLDTRAGAGANAELGRRALALGAFWALHGAWGGRGGYGLGLARDIDLTSGFITSRSTSVASVRTSGPSTAIDARDQLARAVGRCGHRGDVHVSLWIETTHVEIVAVRVELTPRSPALHDCIEDAVWDTDLAIDPAPAHGRTRLEL